VITRRALGLAGVLGALPGCVTGRGARLGVPATGRMLDTVDAAPDAAAAQPAATEEHVVLRDFLRTYWGVLEDNTLGREVRRIADRLLAGWPGPKTTIATYVVPIDSFSAEASRDGAIMLTTRTFDTLAEREELRSEDALAFIIAHELSHVLLGHARDRAQISSAVRGLSGLVTLGATFAAGRQSAGAVRGPIYALFGAVAGAEMIDGAVLTGWAREQEFEADALGVDLMGKAGYSLQVVPRVMAVLEAQEAEADRRRRAAAQPVLAQTDTGFQLRFAPILDALWSDISRTHPAVSERTARVSTYIEREWGDHAPRIDVAGFRRIAGDPQVRAVLTESKMATRMVSNMLEDKPRDAAALLRQMRSPVAESATSDLVKSGLGLAGPELLSKPRSLLRVWQFEAAKAERAGRLDQALEIASVAERRFDQPDMSVWRIQLLKRMGRTTEANLEAMRCFTTGQVGLIEACQRAAR
jgi:Zn-dependent protease with chaperone function